MNDDRRPPITPQLALRVAVLGGIALVLFAIVFFRLWYLQVLSGDQYVVQANENRVRDIRIPAPRGEIVDRNGRTIVDNRNATVVQLKASRLPEAERQAAAAWGQAVGRRQARPKGERGPPVKLPPIATPGLRERYREIGRVLGVKPSGIHRRVLEQLAVVPYADVTIRTDVPRSVLEYFRERQDRFPEVDVEPVYLRRYPQRELAAQLLGTVGEISPRQLKQKRYRDVRQGTVIGQSGIEYSYDRYLRGRDGARRLQVNAFGDPGVELPHARRDPIPGRQLRLSLDLGLQGTAQEAMARVGGGRRGGFVAINPRNGQVHAMGSYPSFDPNVFAKPISPQKFAALNSEANGAPLFNRAIAGLYPTGSTFKPITALAGLDAGVVDTGTVINDGGCITVGEAERCNAGKVAHGPVALRRAMQVSSDIYFYVLGMQTNPLGQPIQRWARRLGLGRRTGIDLPGEFRGLIPDREWRANVGQEERRCRKRNGGKACGISDMRPWSVGDNVNLAIGQGDMQATPLQMAVAYSAIAEGGRVPRPHLGLEVQDGAGRLIQRIEPEPARRVKIAAEWRQALMDGLHAAASQPGGTSTPVFEGWPHDRLPVYGKTGTAERPPHGDQSWYVAYVPHRTKPLVVAATVENGGFGAETAAPIVRLILSEWFGVEKKVAKGRARD